MATCTVDDISVECEGGCGLICTSTQCWSWCEPTDPVVVPAIMMLRRGTDSQQDAVPQEREPVMICTHGVSNSTLASVLQRVLRAELVPLHQDSTEQAHLSFSGTMGELLDYVGLRRGQQQ